MGCSLSLSNRWEKEQMRLNRGSPLSILAIALLISSVATARLPPPQPHAIVPPTGWIKSESNGASIFRPDDVPAGKLYFIIVFPDEVLGKKSLTRWFNSRIDTVLAKAGSLVQRGTVEQKPPKVLSCTSTFIPTSGGQMVSVFTAISPRAGYGRLLVLTSTPEPPLMERYKTASGVIIHEVIAAVPEAKKPKEIPVAPSGEKETAARTGA
jgi:hypothetical protein